MALDILKAFDRLWHAGLLHKFKGYSVSGQIFGIIQLFLTNHIMKVVLNDHVSWSFHINVLVFQVLEFTLFLFFINNLFNVISSQLGICTNDTIIYSCLNSKSDRYDKVKPTVTLENDLQLVVNCAKKLFNFNVYQTKLLFFFF